MNKGYAFGFLIVLLVVILGVYVAVTGFMASREAQQAQAGPEPATPELQAPVTAPAANPTSSPEPTVMTLPTPVPGLTATLTAMAASTGAPGVESTEAVEAPAPTEPAATEPAVTEPPALPTDTPLAPAEPPTPVPVPAYQFRLAGPPAPDPNYPACCYLYGFIRDAAGTKLEGVQVQASTMWTAPVVTTSKGGVDLGKYDIPIGRDAVTWNVFLVDAAGNQISSQVQIQFDPDAANAYRVDWVRTY